MKQTIELNPIYDSRKSFYGKALIIKDDIIKGSASEVLFSYGVPVVLRGGDIFALLPAWDYSATTLRHVKEYLRQNGQKAESKKQISKDYRHFNI